jgi:outer membrane protein assembly factor BamD (BamD/ComL family)
MKIPFLIRLSIAAVTYMLCITIAWPIPTSAQVSFETAVEHYRTGEFHHAYDQFTALLKEHPDDADILFYLAELEPNADQALTYRQHFLSLYPQHQRADEVLYGVAQYHFAVGYYLTAAKDYDRLLGEYHGSGLRAEALYWLASSKLAIGAADTAAIYFRRLIDEYPGSSMMTWGQLGLIDALYMDQAYASAKKHCDDFLRTGADDALIPIAMFRLFEIHEALGKRQQAGEILEQLVSSHPDTYQGKQARRQLTEWGWSQTGPPEEPEHGIGNYTIQVGAFSKRANAVNLESQLRSWGYQVEMIKRAGRHRTLYLIWAGRYRTRGEALDEAKKLERDRGLPYQVIQR